MTTNTQLMISRKGKIKETFMKMIFAFCNLNNIEIYMHNFEEVLLFSIIFRKIKTFSHEGDSIEM